MVYLTGTNANKNSKPVMKIKEYKNEEERKKE